MRSLLLCCALALAACRAAPDSAQNAAAPAAAAENSMTVGDVRLEVETAISPAEQEKGLMFRKTLPPGEGMLFPFVPPKAASFWMKNTVIPLDMIFVSPDGTVDEVFASREPYSLEPTATGRPTLAVLELAGGEAARLGIGKGDAVRWGKCPGGALPRAFCGPPN